MTAPVERLHDLAFVGLQVGRLVVADAGLDRLDLRRERLLVEVGPGRLLDPVERPPRVRLVFDLLVGHELLEALVIGVGEGEGARIDPLHPCSRK